DSPVANMLLGAAAASRSETACGMIPGPCGAVSDQREVGPFSGANAVRFGSNTRGRSLRMKAVSASEAERLLALAPQGDGAALGRLLEAHRSYLALLARLQVGRRLQGKVESADVVQETFLAAHRCFPQFLGDREEEFASWLRQILVSRLAKLIRHYCGTQRRDVRLERQLGMELEQSSRALDRSLVSPGTSPSQPAARREP